MKTLIKQAYEQYEQSDELISMSVPIEIPSAYIDNIVEAHVSSDVEKSLDLIARSECFIPKVNAIEEQVNMQDKAYPLQSLISKVLLVMEKSRTYHNRRGPEKINFISNYMYHLTVNLEVLIKVIFEKLIGEYDLGVDDLMKKFDRWGLLDNRNRPFIEIGMRNFLKEITLVLFIY